jgi:hypothetical protein
MPELTMHDLLAEHLRASDFAKAVLSVPVQPDASPWQKITIRKVALQRGVQLQIARFDGKQIDTKTVDASDPLVAEVAALPFRHLTIQSDGALLECRLTKKGKVLQSRTASHATVSTAHDRPKARIGRRCEADGAEEVPADQRVRESGHGFERRRGGAP